jgi:methionyl-tRNA formyltransferase
MQGDGGPIDAGPAGLHARSTPRRLVAITSGHSFGDRMLRRFAQAGICLDALIVTVRQNTPRQPPERGLRARASHARANLRVRWRAWRRWRHLTRTILVVDSLADEDVHGILVRARPDVLVLAGTGIVPSVLLKLPSVATLNAHPGLLPWVRGVCPLEHALLRGVPLGVTVHAVDAGIDTGPVIRRVLLPLGSGHEDRLSLLRRLEDTAIDALTDVIGAAVRGEPLSMHAQSSRHAYGRWVSDAERGKAVQLLEEGEARRLYEEWRAAAVGDVLPDDDDGLPGPSRMSR